MTRSKLQSWCEGVIEAGWLAALIVAPLFFNVYSSRVFEPDKISLVRTTALIMLLAYLIKVADGGRLWLPRFQEGAEEGSGLPGNGENRSLGSRILRMPFLLPLLFLILAYGISTLLSVAPHVSWWGSYQRLQGTYTFLSYIIIAVLTAAHLRRPEQLRRLQHTIILVSLPIAIYGIVQHNDIDPLPWGGDVVTRVSANAGNPIFLAAYLIMAFFLTLERIFSSFAFLLSPGGRQNGEEAQDEGDGVRLLAHQEIASALLGGAYLFTLVVQSMAIFWTQSRGPWLGWFAGTYLFVLLLVSGLRPRYYRALTGTWVALGLLGALTLVLINVTPLGEPLRDVPYVGRLTTMLDTDDGTNLVRALIWEGVAEMVAPHDPITFPDGTPDRVNAIRPLVGYGPEAMWVAFNNFYPPGLAQVEARNASPDRSHNETWDSLAITGIFGFAAYVLMFLVIFYWSLRWLGLIQGRRDLFLFSGLWMGGGILLSVILYFFDDGWRLFGVALPVGFMLGLVIYITLAVFLHPEARIEESDRRRHVLIIAILATIIAHYIEIHFGIAIASTRTYFWVLTALLLVVGTGLLIPERFAEVVQPEAEGSRGKRGRSRKGGRRDPRGEESGDGWLSALPSTVLPDLLVMMTLAFLYTTNFQGMTSPTEILFTSLTARMEGGQAVTSWGILLLVGFTWLIATTVGLSVAALRRSQPTGGQWWLRGYALYGGLLGMGWFFYGLIQAGRLVPGAAGTTLEAQLNHIAGHFSVYTWVMVLWAILAGMPFAWRFLNQRQPIFTRAAVSLSAGTVVAIVIFFIVGSVNVNLVRADIFYKQGQQFDASGDWVSSAELYRQALDVRPTEDHYMLFLGRSLLERAKQAPAESPLTFSQEWRINDVLRLTPAEISQMSQAQLLRAAEAVLREAQGVNPLNTDHTANLARLHRSWADLAVTPEERQESLLTAITYYDTATILSPNAAHLWNEKGSAYALLGDLEQAESIYLHSLSLDDRFETTYLLLAEVYSSQGRNEDLLAILEEGLEKVRGGNQIRNSLGVALARAGQLEESLAVNLDIMESSPNDANAARNLSILYRDLGEYDNALLWTNRALEIAQRQNNRSVMMDMYRLQVEIYNRLGQPEQVLPVYEQMRDVEPENIGTLINLSQLYLQTDRLQEAISPLLDLETLQPDEYRHPLQLAQIYFDLGDVEAARQSAQTALERAPESEQPAIRQFLQALGS
jgi:tetratricopeptide (TPR) repeat protein